MLKERWVAIRADWIYKGLNLSLAGWIVAAPFLATGARQAILVCIVAWGIAVAVDLSRAVTQVRSPRSLHRNAVLCAGTLRRARRASA
jgi:hypothetical protein